MRKKKSGSSFRSEKKKIDLSILPYKNSLLNFINKKCANTDFEQKNTNCSTVNTLKEVTAVDVSGDGTQSLNLPETHRNNLRLPF